MTIKTDIELIGFIQQQEDFLDQVTVLPNEIIAEYIYSTIAAKLIVKIIDKCGPDFYIKDDKFHFSRKKAI
ncbi:MAG TPA: hypothetical protein PLK94_10590 [Alphaproteobacteria bacterium]|nr:hypothetical protein [Alphaproteobacteria bacterium]